MRYEVRSLLVGIAALAATFAAGSAVADDDLEQKMSDPANWAMQAGDYANHRWSDLKQINAGNVGELQVAWTLSTGVLRGHEGSPLVFGDMMYVHTPFPNNVYAVSLKDQTFKWKYEPKQDADVIPMMCCDTVSRGLAYGDGRVRRTRPSHRVRHQDW
jgi:glucose dehydrogenase